MAKRVFVFPCGSEVGLEIHAALRYSSHVELVGGSSTRDHGSFVFQEFVGEIPTVSEPDFLEHMARLVGKHDVDLIYPATDSAVEALCGWGASLGVTVIGSSPDAIKTCSRKLSTYKRLSGVVAVPEVYSSLEEVTAFPAFIKPNIGHSSIDTFRAPDVLSAEEFLSKFDDGTMLVLEDLPGDEWTVDCFSDRHGELRFHLPRQRSRIKGGISVRTAHSPEVHQEFGNWAKALNSELQPRGAWFFQAKASSSGRPKLLEVGTRPAGSSALSRSLGVNLPLLSVFDALDEDVTFAPNSYSVVLDRALGNRFHINFDYSHIFVDLDDCLMIRGKINSELVAFLFQSSNEGKSITLLTRSARDPEVILNNLRIRALFDRVIHLTSTGARKSSYIDSSDAIFIDDSHSERMEVAANKQIPVFAPDMIELIK